MVMPTTSAEINDWFTKEIENLKKEHYVEGGLADRFYEILEEDCCNINPGDNVWYNLEKLHDYQSELFGWLYDELDNEELKELSYEDIDDMDDLWFREKGDLSVDEVIKRTYVDDLTGKVVNFFREQWGEQFDVDFANNDVIAQ